MGLFIVFIALLVIGGLVVFINNRKGYSDNAFVLGWSSIVCSAVALVIMSVVLIDYHTSGFEYNEARYNNLKRQVEYVGVDGVVTDANLREEVLQMNHDIDKHRVYSKNPWIGVFYSEHLGELEKLEWCEYVPYEIFQ